ncbi:uncharacterized protein [Procambarus clarkii]|uniref:uncharacterized protein isoform X2 n=1 Tax=Procambarus clarkii TaxID=6728 RepID=UPI0037446813
MSDSSNTSEVVLQPSEGLRRSDVSNFAVSDTPGEMQHLHGESTITQRDIPTLDISMSLNSLVTDSPQVQENAASISSNYNLSSTLQASEGTGAIASVETVTANLDIFREHALYGLLLELSMAHHSCNGCGSFRCSERMKACKPTYVAKLTGLVEASMCVLLKCESKDVNSASSSCGLSKTPCAHTTTEQQAPTTAVDTTLELGRTAVQEGTSRTSQHLEISDATSISSCLPPRGYTFEASEGTGAIASVETVTANLDIFREHPLYTLLLELSMAHHCCCAEKSSRCSVLLCSFLPESTNAMLQLHLKRNKKIEGTLSKITNNEDLKVDTAIRRCIETTYPSLLSKTKVIRSTYTKRVLDTVTCQLEMYLMAAYKSANSASSSCGLSKTPCAHTTTEQQAPTTAVDTTLELGRTAVQEGTSRTSQHLEISDATSYILPRGYTYEEIKPLWTWLSCNAPRKPSRREKAALVIESGLSSSEVTTWFSAFYRRNRLMPVD